MHNQWTADTGAWLETGLALAAGGTLIIVLAALAERMIRSAAWTRTLWRVAVAAMGLLVLVELNGVGAGLAWWVWARSEASPAGQVGPEDPRALESSGVFSAGAAPAEEFGRIVEPDERPEPGTGERSVLRSGFLRAPEIAFEAISLDPPNSPPARLGSLDDDAGSADAFRSTAGPTAGAWEEPSDAVCAFAEPDGLARVPGWGLVWLVGAAVLALRMAWARVALAVFVARGARPVRAAALRSQVAALCASMRIGGPVRLLQSDAIAGPVAFGSVRPTVLLPSSFSADFDRRQQEAMLAHELAHLGARDPLWRWIADLVTAGVWWHPLAWWARSRLRVWSEAAADEASLLVPEGPDALAASLVQLGRRLVGRASSRFGWLSAGGGDFRSGLGKRVQRLLDLPMTAWRAPARGAAVLVTTTLPVLLVALALFGTSWGRPQASLAKGETTMKMLQISWHRSLAAATVMPLLALFSSDALPDDGPVAPRDRAVGVADPVQGDPLALLAEVPERERAEAREREAREKAEARERKRREAEEAKSRKRREHEEAERREREARERREHEEREEAEARERREMGEREAHEHRAHEHHERARHLEELEQEYRELQEKAEHLKRELAELRDDQDEEARELREALGDISARMDRIQRELHRPQRGRREAEERGRREHRERDEHALRERLEELEQAYHRARDAGRMEEAERIRRGMTRMAAALRRRPPARPAAAGVPPQVRRELEELQGAVRALHGQVLATQREMEEMRRAMERQMDEMRRMVKMLAEPSRGNRSRGD